ncbi:protein arginine N-methyltransferase 9-like isoform X2 [Daktulosphaira vitifoliae]|nr:protein arginine N-methyltransferase 9-like isoform X2 [Daktulosphaira vitifoliae]XP_050541224.1 protein arginine N-methyltransferase 9-like isoform X2 [Daktulosphaira vitifoliae]
MLNDSIRNLAYRNAIHCKILEGYDKILDIGCGTLILSLFASELTPKKIYSCDYSPTMLNIASEVMILNKKEKCIKLFNMNSNQLSIPEHIDERVSLVVTEIMDAGLFGEHILKTLHHAWEHLLLPPKTKENLNIPHGCVIPLKASVFAVPIQCSYLRRKNIYSGKNNSVFKDLNLCSVMNEPYDCEKLDQLPGGYTFLAEPKVIMDINFNDPSEISHLINVQDSKKTFKYTITKSGIVDAIASWFTVYLTEDIYINTFEKGYKDCCWEQALFLSKNIVNVNEKDELCILYKWQNDHYSLCLENEDLSIISIDREIISFLNDKSQIETYISAAKYWYSVNKSKFNTIVILDVCPFPIFGLEILSMAQTCNFNHVKLYYTNKNLTEVLEKIEIYTSEFIKGNICYFDKSNSTMKFDIIIVNYISYCGELSSTLIDESTTFFKLLNPNGIILPSNVSIKCQLIYSKWLPYVSQVLESDSCNNHIRNLLNKYSVNHHLDVFNHLITSTLLSSSITCLSLSSNLMTQEVSSVIRIPIISNGCANAIIYFFEINVYGSYKVTTGIEDSYVNQCAFLIENPKYVYLSDSIAVNVIYDSGHLLLNLNNS